MLRPLNRSLQAASACLLVLLAAGCSSTTAPGPTEPNTTSSPPTSDAKDTNATPAPTAAPTAAPSAEPAAAAPPAAPPEPPKPVMKTFALAEFKLPLSVEAPESSKLSANTSKDKLGGVNLEDDATKLDLRIMTTPGDMATNAGLKTKLGKMIRPATSFPKEESDLIVYERKGGDFGFAVRVKAGGKNYLCMMQGGGEAADKLEAAIAVCKSVKSAK